MNFTEPNQTSDIPTVTPEQTSTKHMWVWIRGAIITGVVMVVLVVLVYGYGGFQQIGAFLGFTQ